MKILGSVERHYNSQLEKYEKLKEEVDRSLGGVAKRNKWSYTSRIKDPENFALKLETSHTNPIEHSTEDFFGCRLVVENRSQLEAANQELMNYVCIIHPRPTSTFLKTKSPDSFPYDSLRLYVKLQPQQNLPSNHPPNNLTDVLFEVQVKTFFQHVWDTAVHDVVYKGKEVGWPESRTVHQLKAMLEHAEISIQLIDQFKNSTILNISNEKIDNLIAIQKFLQRNWNSDQLPTDLNRLSQNLGFLLKHSKINLEEMQTILNEELDSKRGPQTLNLSPYFTIVQAIINKQPQKMKNFINHKRTKKIIMPPEMKIDGITLNRNKIIHIE